MSLERVVPTNEPEWMVRLRRKQSVSLDVLQLLKVNALMLHHMCMCGQPTPHQKKVYERIIHPVPGDLVLEITTAMRDRDREGNAESEIHNFGRLIQVTMKRLSPGRPRKDGSDLTDVWEIKCPDGTIKTWENCCFIVVLEEKIPVLDN